MKRTWQVHHDTVSHPDGQRRWDRAYQLLLRWADDAQTAPPPPITQEDEDAGCRVCPGLDQSPTSEPHD